MFRTVRDSNVAADLAQEAFTKAYVRLETFQLGKRFFPWLYSLALNVARDHLRSRGRDFHVYMEDPASMVSETEGGSEHDSVERFLDGEKIFEYVLGMAPKYREALILRFRNDLTFKEIASALEITVSGAKMRVSRGLEMIRHEFKEVSDVR